MFEGGVLFEIGGGFCLGWGWFLFKRVCFLFEKGVVFCLRGRDFLFEKEVVFCLRGCDFCPKKCPRRCDFCLRRCDFCPKSVREGVIFVRKIVRDVIVLSEKNVREGLFLCQNALIFVRKRLNFVREYWSFVREFVRVLPNYSLFN